MNSRSGWLNHTREYLKQDQIGKKFFKVRKNIHNFDLSPKSLTPLNNRKLDLSDHQDKMQIKLYEIRQDARMTPNLGRIIKDKDQEITNLRKMYKEATSKLKIFESNKQSREEEIVRPSLASSSYKRIDINEIKLPVRQGLISGNYSVRNKSTRKYRPDNFQDFSFLNSVRFTKNRPKIVLGNPITGIPINLP